MMFCLDDVLVGVSSKPVRGAFLTYKNDEEGAITPFIIVLFLIMVLSAGMAVDFMRHEMARADLQSAIDRGVLAAANANQSIAETQSEYEDLVEEYLDTRNHTWGDVNLSVSIPSSGNFSVTANADFDMNTHFLKLMGINDMAVPARAQAQEAAGDLEVSLILDVSDSMTGSSTYSSGTRLTDLQNAAKEFVDTILLNSDSSARTTISIIPYSAQVNMPDWMAAHYNISGHHDYSNCIDFDASDFLSASISTSSVLQQSQHFIDYYYEDSYTTTTTTYQPQTYTFTINTWFGPRTITYTVNQAVTTTVTETITVQNHLCPQTSNEILPFSNDRDALHQAIDNLQSEGWTAAYNGMKWGVALLDPEASPLIDTLIASGDLPSTYSGRPVAWNNTSVQKVVVLMTDGRNTILKKMKDSAYESQTTEYWNENVPASNQIEYVVNNDDDGLGDDYLEDICDVAKLGANTTVYTIGFEISPYSHEATVLENCASSAATDYTVDGVDIETAFASIAAQIEVQKLSLTQ